MKENVNFGMKPKINYYAQKKDEDVDQIQMTNFFDLTEDELKCLNPYNFEEALKRIENLKEEDVLDDLQYFQKKEFEFRNYEEEHYFSLDKIQFVTSSLNDNDNEDFFLLKDLSEYLISKEEAKNSKEKDSANDRISLEIKNVKGDKKEIFINCLVDRSKLSENIEKNFIEQIKEKPFIDKIANLFHAFL